MDHAPTCARSPSRSALDGPDALEVGPRTAVGRSCSPPASRRLARRAAPLPDVGPLERLRTSRSGSIDDAGRPGKAAILDPVTRQLTALRTGSVTVTFESDSMREHRRRSVTDPRREVDPRRPFGAAGVPPTVGGTVPATLSLTLGPPASFGVFVAGVDAPTSLDDGHGHLVRGRRDAHVVPLRANLTGFLANGAFRLAQPLHRSPAPRSYSGPMSDQRKRGVDRLQAGHRPARDPLRTGSYAKTLTYTLSTTAP